jgi:hypothetical protein
MMATTTACCPWTCSMSSCSTVPAIQHPLPPPPGVCRSWRSLTSDPLASSSPGLAHSRRRPCTRRLALRRQRRDDELHVVDLQDKMVVKRIHLTHIGAYLLAHLDLSSLPCVLPPLPTMHGDEPACVLNLQQGNGPAAITVAVDVRRLSGDGARICILGQVFLPLESTRCFAFTIP